MRSRRSFFRSLLLALPAGVLACNGDDLSGPATGTLEIVISTTGVETDPDGYTLSIDAQPQRAIPSAGSLQSTGISPGDHTVRLAGMAANCVVRGENPLTIRITAGETTKITFIIECVTTNGWTSIPFPSGFTPSGGLWASSATDLFVGGTDRGAAVILHYDGQAWARQARREGVEIRAMWGSSSTDVFAVSTPSADNHDGRILHYDGAQWTDMAGPPLGGDAGGRPAFQAIWGTSPRDVFAGGRVLTASGARELLAHYDGDVWSEILLPGTAFQPVVVDLSGASATDVYAIVDGFGCNNCHGHWDFVAHSDGTGWAASNYTSDNRFKGLWVTGRDDVWIVGAAWDGAGYLLHYDGTSWSETFRRNVDGSPQPALNDVWGSSSSDVYAVGQSILHYDGSAWNEINHSAGLRVWGISTTDVFVLAPTAVLHYRR